MKSEDLLTGLTELDDDLILDAHTPLARHAFHKRRLMALLTAAVIASTLALTAFAASDASVWFRNFFAEKSGTTLSDGQMSYLGDYTAQFQQSQSINGYTITLHSAISDGRFVLIQCDLAAPEGTILDADHYGDRHGTILWNPDCDSFPCNWTITDDDPADNTVTMLCSLDIIWCQGNHFDFTKHPWQLLIYGLGASYYENEGTVDFTSRTETLTEGAWSFDVRFPEGASRTAELIQDPMNCPGDVNYGIQGLAQRELQITSFTLRALSAELSFRFSKADTINGRFDDIYAVMTDGTKVLLREYSNVPNQITYKFDAPISLEEVDHILLPNGTKLPMPQG